MTATEAAAPTEREIEDTYNAALGYAVRRAPRPAELRESAKDAATDGVMWALKNYQAGHAGTFEAFAMSAVRKFVTRHIKRSAAQFHNRPSFGELTEGIPAREVQGGGDLELPLSVRDLPNELRTVVRLFYIDKYDFRDIGFLMGCSMETARGKLQRAAAILGKGLERPSRMTGTRRLYNGIRGRSR